MISNFDPCVIVILLSYVENSFQFSIGWWIIIDAAVMYPSEGEMHHAVHVCGVIGTVALFMYALFRTKLTPTDDSL